MKKKMVGILAIIILLPTMTGLSGCTNPLGIDGNWYLEKIDVDHGIVFPQGVVHFDRVGMNYIITDTNGTILIEGQLKINLKNETYFKTYFKIKITYVNVLEDINNIYIKSDTDMCTNYYDWSGSKYYSRFDKVSSQ